MRVNIRLTCGTDELAPSLLFVRQARHSSRRALISTLVLMMPGLTVAQHPSAPPRWVGSGSIGLGGAEVARYGDSTYSDAGQITARVGLGRSLAYGLSAGVMLVTTIGVTGGDCIPITPCAPWVDQQILGATLSYVHGGAIRRFMPTGSAAVGVARLPGQWAPAPRLQADPSRTLSLSAALEIPIFVKDRTAFLLGWEMGVFPNATREGIRTYALLLSLRRRLGEND